MLNKSIASAGAISTFIDTLTTNTENLNLQTWATSRGWVNTLPADITISAGVYVWSNSNSLPALNTGSFPVGLTLRVNGYVMGKGGMGSSSNSGVIVNGENGGPAMAIYCNVVVVGGSSGYIGGGGGGGAGGDFPTGYVGTGGGGAGGGPGGYYSGTAGSPPQAFLLPSPAGGEIGQVGANGVYYQSYAANASLVALVGLGGGSGGSGACGAKDPQ